LIVILGALALADNLLTFPPLSGYSRVLEKQNSSEALFFSVSGIEQNPNFQSKRPGKKT
jgi:hypothetical protein